MRADKHVDMIGHSLAMPMGRAWVLQPDLVTLAKQRDEGAWSAIYAQHYDSLFRYLYSRLGRREEAEDLTEQVFLEAYKGVSSYTDRGKPLQAWLFGIARNLANGLLRSRRRRGEVTLLDSEQFEDAKATPGGLGDERLDLLAAVNQLTKDQRETIILRFYMGLTAKEVASALDKTEGAIFALQIRAIAALRRTIGEDAGTQQKAAA